MARQTEHMDQENRINPLITNCLTMLFNEVHISECTESIALRSGIVWIASARGCAEGEGRKGNVWNMHAHSTA